MITKDIQDITETDLQALIDNFVYEGKYIEYKERLPGSSDSDKKEFLADISSFANASGGKIIYGISEDSQTGNPKELVGLAATNIDIEIGRLDNVIRTGIEPRLPSFTIKPIRLQNSKSIIIVQIAKSWNSPHRVTFQKHDKFYSRSSNGKYSLDVTELKVAFNLSETINERIKSFKSERISSIFANEACLPLQDSARIVLHLIPYNAFMPGQRCEIEKRQRIVGELMPIGAKDWNGKFNFDGYISYSGVPELKYRSYTQLFRNGIIEAVESSFLKFKIEGEGGIPINYCEGRLINHLHAYLKLLKSFDIELPIIGFLTFLGVKNYKLVLSPRFTVWEYSLIDRDILNLPEFIIEDYDTKPDRILRPCFDTIWNACGFTKSSSYDENGNWQDTA